jgi:heat shock protein HslJ
MSSRSIVTLAGLSVVALVLSACASGRPGADPTPPSAQGATSVAGEWRADAPATAWLMFDEAGGVTGSDGCNGVGGTVASSGDEIRFTLDPSTLKACVGVTVSFSQLRSAVVSGDVMTTMDSSGGAIVELRRQ